MKKIIYSVLFLATCLGYSQTESERNEIRSAYDAKQIKELKQEVSRITQERKQRVDAYIKSHQITDKEYIHHIYDIINGEPLLRASDNKRAARLTRTFELHSGGSLGLSLEGENYTVGVWDGEKIMPDHVEFKASGEDSRVTFGDANSLLGGHGTHVGGTVGASGVDPEAKGMAPKVSIMTYDWTNDTNEVLEEAEEGLLISNHSYGIPAFNNYGNPTPGLPKEYIGAYITESYLWDYIVYEMEYYLPVISAGNDGGPTNDEAMSAGYDKLVGNKTSKNVLVIANSTSPFFDPETGERLTDAVINPSSSQGPTDDGRVKPDIAGMGSGVYSSVFDQNDQDANDLYGIMTGTSMASPNVAGSLILLQEYNNNLYDEHLKAYELKNLIIHNPYDPATPSEGPDPLYGWGVLDAVESALIIEDKNSTSTIFEDNVLVDEETKTYEITVAEDGKFTASIAWNDIPGHGEPGIPGNNPEMNDTIPALINDLDIRLTNTDTDEEHLPWVLDMSTNPIVAIKADNSVDNVEKIEVNDLPEGNYTLEVSHKGSLEGGSQSYSIIVTGIEAYLSTNKHIADNNDIAVWPNPVNNKLNVTNTQAFENDVEINIYDLSGRLVQSVSKSSNRNSIQVDTSVLSTGTYLVKITDGEKSYNKKIIKE
ncbi:MAG: S8/S53 family peptidase [Flavobacteriaceae bacterium]